MELQANYAAAFALCFPASLLISVHAYAQDALLLLAPLALIHRHPMKPPMIRFAALMTVPVTPVLILLGAPWSALYPVLLAAWVAVAAISGPDQGDSPTASLQHRSSPAAAEDL